MTRQRKGVAGIAVVMFASSFSLNTYQSDSLWLSAVLMVAAMLGGWYAVRQIKTDPRSEAVPHA